ncbi:alpha-ketoglutarate-dependent dioxygenase AlkB [uncultured Maribacter sp.]|uniref:alpha-ketoglutarate-dependent dioxygenase AlkB family protein n=1 Tax=uncultured Maribacter sp. TaxID=431308 RepID=UPI00261F8B52|nr:alpha-ketoglutarate-dependent dioxygenase AlkB [uncultured Maribacter sp.]
MDLFNTEETPNILPFDGEVLYYGTILDLSKCLYYYDILLNTIEWKPDEAIIFGKQIFTKRKVAWYAEKSFEYTYSNNTKISIPWTKELLELKNLVENKTGETYNSCLLNLYHSGEEGMAWHSDGEKDLKKNGTIASLSFGAERKFLFKHKETKQKISIVLEKGSLLAMKGTTQKNWLHRLPPTKKVFTPRINLTFRTIKAS